PHEYPEKAGVDVVRVLGDHVSEKLSLRGIVGGLEAAEQFKQCSQHLLCKLSRDDILIPTAVCKDRSQTLFFGQAEEPLRGKEHVHRCKYGPSGNGRHVRHAERGVATRYATWGVDKSQVRVIEQEPDRDLAFA